MERRFVILQRQRVELMQMGFNGFVLVEAIDQSFDSVEEAEAFLDDPKNKFPKIPYFILEGYAYNKP